MKRRIWIDIINPSHPLFFNPIIKDLKKEYEIYLTVRNRAETVGLSKQLDFTFDTIDSFNNNSFFRPFTTIKRVIDLSVKVKNFDYSISFENAECVSVTKFRKKKSILFLDNDLKFLLSSHFIQNLESKVKLFADIVIIPEITKNKLKKFFKKDKIYSYPGFKEDIYIADYKPNPNVKKIIPFEDFVVIRPEALGSFYVREKKSIVPEILSLFEQKNINVVYLPREKSDRIHSKNNNIFIPKKPINGLDLVYYSSAVLTGSGTMAREAALMGRTAVSFFPNKDFLSVDEHLIKENKMLHSRNPKEIYDYISYQKQKNISKDFNRSKTVKNEIMKTLNNILD